MFPMRPAIFLFALFALGGAANAADNPACAKFENALAYNACLAKLGPKAYAAAPTARALRGSARKIRSDEGGVFGPRQRLRRLL